MSFQKPKFVHPLLPENELGYKKTDYQGVISTLCAGCGHDSISAAIVEACWELSIEPHNVAKLSGIGCSSKTPAYYLSNSHGFNSVHGRMPSVATGANLANKQLTYLGVSGDGDSASIGMGQFVHVVRRNLNMTYIVMNNGCYGLTKGQDSATADFGSINKSGNANPFEGIDLAGMAIDLGAGFVARSFSGDKSQLIPLIKAALSFPGFALIDVVSPCVTFNNNAGSTKSYKYVRDHDSQTSKIEYFDDEDSIVEDYNKINVKEGSQFVPDEKEILVDYQEGDSMDVTLHDGSVIHLSKLSPKWDPRDRRLVRELMMNSKANSEILTGLLFIDTEKQELQQILNTVDKPLNTLTEKELCPGSTILSGINDKYR